MHIWITDKYIYSTIILFLHKLCNRRMTKSQKNRSCLVAEPQSSINGQCALSSWGSPAPLLTWYSSSEQSISRQSWKTTKVFSLSKSSFLWSCKMRIFPFINTKSVWNPDNRQANDICIQKWIWNILCLWSLDEVRGFLLRYSFLWEGIYTLIKFEEYCSRVQFWHFDKQNRKTMTHKY